VYIKLVGLRINRYTRSSSQFQKGWWPLVYIVFSGDTGSQTNAV